MRFEEAVKPKRDLMLVRREPGNDAEWNGLHLPASARKASDIRGTILEVGLESLYEVGTQVIMSRNSGTTVALLEGNAEELAIVSPIDVLAILLSEYVGSAIPVDAALLAPPLHLLVERVELPLRIGRIHLPPKVRKSTRSCEATIVSVGAGIQDEYAEGETVLLSTNVGRDIKMGMREERKLYRVTPAMVLAGIEAEAPALANEGEAPQGIPEWEVEQQSYIDEGSPEALR